MRKGLKKLRSSWSWQKKDKKKTNIFCHFFNSLFNFRAHALQSELDKVGIYNFVKFRLQSMRSKIKQAFEKNYKIFPNDRVKKDIN